jgi:hypothetical protein
MPNEGVSYNWMVPQHCWDFQAFSSMATIINAHDSSPGRNALLSGGGAPLGRTILKTCKIDATAMKRAFSAKTRPGHALFLSINGKQCYKSLLPSSETKGCVWVLHFVCV